MNCEMCGEKFTPRDGNQKYCCDKCRKTEHYYSKAKTPCETGDI